MWPMFLVCLSFSLDLGSGNALPPVAADAGGLIFTTGPRIGKLGNIDPKFVEKVESETQKGVAVGFLYEHLGLFWIDIWTWRPEYVLYKGESTWALTNKECSEYLGIPPGSLPIPWWYRSPPGMFLVLGFVFVVLPWLYYRSQASSRERKRINNLLKDERYNAALDVYQRVISAELLGSVVMMPKSMARSTDDDDPIQHSQKNPKAFEAGVEHLVHVGIPRLEARENLENLLAVLESGD